MNTKPVIPPTWHRTRLKLTHWEFWPTWLVYLPVLMCYPYWALRSGSVFFFSLVNPKMRMGGLYGASKFDTLKQLDLQDIPTTRLFQAKTSLIAVKAELALAQLIYPLIVKPDLGERGKGVQQVWNDIELEQAVTTQTSDFLIQEYLDLPFEAGVFYIRKPGKAAGEITSIVVKEFLTIIGDGHSTIEELALKNMRSVMIWKQLKSALPRLSTEVLKEGETLVLEPIGNHSRGTAFVDGNSLVTEALTQAIQQLAQKLPKFYYGRFDLRTSSLESFQKGECLKIMEVNGANAEPAHIYHEGASLLKGWKTLMRYWNIQFRIAQFNKKRFAVSTFSEALDAYRNWQNIKKEKWNPKQELVTPVQIDPLA